MCKIVAIVAVLLAAVVGCGSGSEPDFAACKQAIRTQIDSDEPLHGSEHWKRPPACEGVDDSMIYTLSADAFREKMRDDIAKEATVGAAGIEGY